MIVEIVGPSGAGKSTLAAMLRDPGADPPTLLSTDLVLDRPGRRWIRHPTARNLVGDLAALPWLLSAWDRYEGFLRFAARRLRAHAPSALARHNYLRNIVRRVGLHELARRRDIGATIVADEGTLHTAYYLFVYSTERAHRSELVRFAELAPLPDRVVHVRASIPDLVERSLRRPDPRRELRGASRPEVERWLRRATEVFDELLGLDPLRERVLVVDSADGGLDPAAVRARLMGARAPAAARARG
ncbi:MAG TPA: AAA family ATPase [Actinomycetota bacterium]|nr:AAA family ATPase [Actinomycetota bacterium]